MATKPKTVSDFRAAHDKNVIIPMKIEAALAAMRKIGAEHWEYDGDFIKLSGVSQTDMALFRDQFEKYWILAPGQHSKTQKRVWFADAKVAAKLRNA